MSTFDPPSPPSLPSDHLQSTASRGPNSQGLSGWLVFGGTSVAAPALAGVFNLAGHFYASSNIEQSTFYSNVGTANLRDIIVGTAGAFSAGPGWDFVTGVGSVKGVAGK